MITDGEGRPYNYRVEIAPVLLPPEPGPRPLAVPPPPRKPLTYFCGTPDFRAGAILMSHAVHEQADPSLPVSWLVVPLAWPLVASVTYIGPDK